MISVEWDSSHLRKIAVIAAAFFFCYVQENVLAFVMAGLAAYYAAESHSNYKLAKRYRRLGRSMGAAIPR